MASKPGFPFCNESICSSWILCRIAHLLKVLVTENTDWLLTFTRSNCKHIVCCGINYIFSLQEAIIRQSSELSLMFKCFLVFNKIPCHALLLGIQTDHLLTLGCRQDDVHQFSEEPGSETDVSSQDG